MKGACHERNNHAEACRHVPVFLGRLLPFGVFGGNNRGVMLYLRERDFRSKAKLRGFDRTRGRFVNRLVSAFGPGIVADTVGRPSRQFRVHRTKGLGPGP